MLPHYVERPCLVTRQLTTCRQPVPRLGSLRVRGCHSPPISVGRRTMLVSVGMASAGGGDPYQTAAGADGIFVFRKSGTQRVVAAASGQLPVLICPGFGNNTADYTSPFGNREESLAAALERRGFTVGALKIERGDWFNVARALFTTQFWSNNCTADQGYLWYLELLAASVEQLRRETGAPAVHIVAHSAGGWLARAFLADERFGAPQNGANPSIRSITTLGTPHLAPPEGVADMTRGALTWLNTRWPGAYFSDAGVGYTCVVGKAIRADPLAENVRGRRTLAGYASSSYSQLLGPRGADEVGDCVVPCECARLPGAAAVELEGVYHSMSRVGTFEDPSGLVWYGSEDVVDEWAAALTRNGGGSAAAAGPPPAGAAAAL